MKLLFIQGGTRLKKDVDGNLYTDGNFNNKVWDRYKEYSDELMVVLREEDKIYDKEYAISKFNSLNQDSLKIFAVPDLMRPASRFINLRWRNKAKKGIEEAVKQCDKAIIRSAHNFYTLTAVKMCKKYKKPYLIEVAGYAFDGYWNHGDIYGKVFALPYELLARRAMKDADYCVYVTKHALQKRYPCKNKTLGCSDVELKNINENDLINKLNHFANKKNNKIVLGTIGWVNLKLKGQQDVIKVLNRLKKKGINNFEYQLVGLGDSSYLESLIKKYNLQDNVKILGPMPHDKVFEWLNAIDLYVQPSYTEGLCRAIVEAMSKACPILVSDAGGNPELANPKYVFKKGNLKELENILKNITNDDLIVEAKRSFEESKKYEKTYLDSIRNDFYIKFIDGE